MLSKLQSGLTSLLKLTRKSPELGTASSGATARDPLDEMMPDESVSRYVGSIDAEQFKSVGKMMVEWFQIHAQLQPSDRVLEVGCGIGRIAIPLTQFITTGSYVGFDIVPHGIEWCQRKVTPKYPNFTFFLADVYNKFYHPAGRHKAADYSFPLSDESFDFVFLTSVFTHMLPSDVERYAGEIGRVLRIGGRCFITAYVISDQAVDRLRNGSSRRKFVAQEGYWTESPTNPEAAIAYSDAELKRIFSQALLEPSKMIAGEWWNNEFAQDVIVLRKVARAA